jgi:hypothetical protein
MSIKTDIMIVGGIGLGVIVLAWYAKSKVAAVPGQLWDAAQAAAPYVNPADNNNVVNKGVSWVGSLISGQPNWTLGGSIYDATHGGALDVTSSNNLIYSGVSGIGGAVTGDTSWTLGGAIYDWTH